MCGGPEESPGGGGGEFDLARWQAGGTSSFSGTVFAPYWDGLPNLVAVDGNGDGSAPPPDVDPYRFSHRMALGKYLIQNTGGEKVWGRNCSRHWFWGYIAQLDWQRRSGRFEDPSEWKDEVDESIVLTGGGYDTDEISKRSWWGRMNLEFSVAVYCGAAEAGLVPRVTISSEDVASDASFQKCVELWRGFWQTIHSEFLASHEEDYDGASLELYRGLWPVHTEVIKAGMADNDLGKLMPKEDLGVGLGWCQMVEILAATNWPLLSLDSLHEFGAGYLPTVRVSGPKTMEWLKEHRPREHKTVTNMHGLKDVPANKMERMCSFWARVTWWNFARNNLPRYLHALSHGSPIQKLVWLARVLALAAFPHSYYEAGVWLGMLSILIMYKR